MTKEATVISGPEQSAGPVKGRGKVSSDGNVVKGDEPIKGEAKVSLEMSGKKSDAQHNGEKLDGTRQNEDRSDIVKVVEVVNQREAPRRERLIARNCIPRRVFARRRENRPIFSCSQKVKFFVSQCVHTLTHQRDGERVVMSRIERRKEFVRVHTTLFIFEVSSLTVSAILYPVGARAIAKLIWLLSESLQPGLILTEVIKACNRMLGWNFEEFKAERKMMWKIQRCCLFYAELVAQMKAERTQFIPFLRILIRLIRNLLNTGNRQNVSCAKTAMKISCEALVQKRPKEFAAIFSTLEHLIIQMNDPREDGSLFYYMCAKGIHGKICACAKAAAPHIDGKEKEETESSSKHY